MLPTPFFSRHWILCLFLFGCLAPKSQVMSPNPTSTVPRTEIEAKSDNVLEADQEVTSDKPVVLSLLRNLNDYVYFANGAGWDADYYVGYPNCFVVRLPPAPPGKYVKAYLGAKLGRMKSEPIPGRPAWEKRPVRGEINIAVANEPVWPHSRRHFLTSTKMIPLEGDSENVSKGVGESRWFWTEIPLREISQEKENFVALFSPSRSLKSRQHSPILAAGPSSRAQKKNAWLAKNVKGKPPFHVRDVYKTPVHYAPAMAIKLVPAHQERQISVQLIDTPPEGEMLPRESLWEISVEGTDIDRAWVEFTTDTKVWYPLGRPVYDPPYTFSLKRHRLFGGENQVRFFATDFSGNQGESDVVRVQVPKRRPKKSAVKP